MKSKEQKFWHVEQSFKGQTAVILASGPSMSKEVVAAIRPTLWRTIAINSTFRLARWAEILYCADNKYWMHPNNKDALEFGGLKVTIEDPRGERLPNDDILVLRNDGVQGFTDDRSAIRHGNNSGYQSIHLAAHLGASKIILCGFDMRAVNDRQHWHGRHPDGLRDHGSSIYIGWLRSFDTLAPELKKRGIEVYNCTPQSALTCFEMMDLAEAISRWDGVNGTDLKPKSETKPASINPIQATA